MTLTQPSIPPVSLTALPIELLTQICLSLDKKSALSLIRVAKAFISPAEHRIYRDIDLFLPASYGELPLIQPHKRSGHGAHVVWAKAEAKLAEERHREALKAKVQEIMVASGGRRLKLVEKVTMVSRPGAVNAILALLDVLSPTLRSLELKAPAKHVFEAEWRSTDTETFDVKLFGYHISFTSLTSLRLDKYAIRFAETVLILCQIMPSLISLDVDLYDHDGSPRSEDGQVINKPRRYGNGFELPTLRNLRLAYHDRTNEDDDRDDFHHFMELLESSPNLEKVSLRIVCDDDQFIYGHFTRVLGEKKHLRELFFEITPEQFCEAIGEEEVCFPSLERLVLSSDDSLDFFHHLPELPKLIAFNIHHSEHRLKQPALVNYPEPAPHPTMLPDFAKSLRNSPNLAVVNLVNRVIPKSDIDEPLGTLVSLGHLEASNRVNGFVRSFVHGSEELLHARLFRKTFEISDEIASDAVVTSPHRPVIEYTDRDGQARQKVYEHRSEAQWADYTDFSGHKVPLEIIQKMRQVQGVSVEKWEGRGVEVGDAAWKVLTDWRDAEEVAVKVQI